VPGIEGRVAEPDGRPIRGALVEVRTAGSGTIVRTVQSDQSGYFRVQPLDPGEYRLHVRRLGYDPGDATVQVGPDDRTRHDVVLEPRALRLDEMTVGGARTAARARFEDEAGATTREISGEAIRSLPGLSEGDPLRAVEILPGVVSSSDLSASFNVRGGSADQNLILLDGFPLFNPFHLGGVFSVFNADMVDRVELQSGGFGPEFGGRVSSVLRVETDPGTGDLGVDGGVSLLAARAAVSGSLGRQLREPLGLRSARWRISGRRSYVDRLLKPVTELPYAVTDLQGAFEGWTPGGSRIAVTAYTGRDVLDMGRISTDDFPLRLHWGWGNDLLGARWTRPFHGGGQAEVRVGGTRFDSRLRFTDYDDSELGSEVSQLILHGSVERYLGARWRVGTGLDLDRYAFSHHAESGGTSLGSGAGAGSGAAPWGRLEWHAPGAWIVSGGLRMEGWMPEAGEPVLVPSPRISAKRFFAGGEGAVRASAGRYAQFAQSIRDEELPLGIDVWMTAGEGVPHLVSDQIQVGVERYLGRSWLVALDAYHRTFDGVITTNPASDPNQSDDDVVRGRGRGYGGDLFLERSEGRVTGSFAASWTKADRRFPDVLSGREDAPEVTYPPVFDRRLDLDVVLRFPLPRDWKGSLRWHVGSGLPYTRPLAYFAYFEPRYTQDGRLRWQGTSEGSSEPSERRPYAVAMGERNQARYPTYHRLDVSLRRTFTPSWGTVTPYLDLLNVYNQANVLFYFYDFESDPPTRSGLSMFPLLPTFGVGVRF
jgi:hypothetical protein